LLLFACDSPPPEQRSEPAADPWFVDEAADRGIDFTWNSGAAGDLLMPEIIGGGGGLVDVDGDGDLDLYLVQASDDVNRLLRNDNGHFTDITPDSGAGDAGYGMGLAVGDYDNDGDSDLYITNVGPNVLLQNNGDGTFVDVTAYAGVGDAGWGAGTVFADLDCDGDLDLYAANYLVWSPELSLDCYSPHGILDYCSPENFLAPARDLLYQNNGDGTFADMAEAAGIGGRLGTGLGVLANDYTGDGLVDIFVANDGMPDQLWRNNGDWTFTDIGLIAGCAVDDEGTSKAGMGVTSTDIDSDGDLDILVCNLYGESDSLFRNDGDYFTDITAAAGVRAATQHATRFGLGWVDFDNDGHLDLFEANGGVQRLPSPATDDPYAEENHLLIGEGLYWRKHPLGDGIANDIILTSRGAAFGDIDGDGGMDVVVINKDAPANLLMNIAPNRGSWVRLHVIDERNRDAIGAWVSWRQGGQRHTAPVQAGWSYLASNDPAAHIGLGSEELCEEVLVRWMDTSVESFGSLPAGRSHTLRRGTGRTLH
jgi:hypothetical protein